MVNVRNFTSYALIGSGRLAQHLAIYLKELNVPFVRWARARDPEYRLLNDVVSPCSHVLLAVSDRAIAEVMARCPGKPTFVHFSGALNVPGAIAAHPLMTFGSESLSSEAYREIPFVIDEGVELKSVLPGFPNKAYSLKPEARAHYHALCSLAGNSSFLLSQKIGQRFQNDLGLPAPLLEPFLKQVVHNSLHGTADSFTGPVARGDWKTIEAHLSVLNSDPALSAAYRSYLNLARNTGYEIPEELS